jgi:hypothetical protein
MATSPPYHRGNTYASLYTLASTEQLQKAAMMDPNQELPGTLRINFPAMPETLTLARQAVYNKINSPAAPDGFHWYRHTEPLTIPIKFSLAGFDKDYCREDGPYALLDTTAKLHAMAMPVVPATGNETKQAGLAVGNQGSDAQVLATSQAGSAQLDQPRDVTVSVVGENELKASVSRSQSDIIYFPPACVLSIILAELPGRPPLGVQCIGFVDSVDVTFHAPWLQSGGQAGAAIVNLPSRADFEFKFVHQPNYTNAINAETGGVNKLYTTTAETVRNRLYNQFAAGTPQTQSVLFANLFGRIKKPG